MLKRFRSRLTYSNVVSSLALFLALSTGAAYAANTVFSTDIVDGEVKTPDLATAGVTSLKLAANSVGGGKVIDHTLTAADLAANSVGSGEVVDFGLTNQDVAVEFAQIRADSTVANSSGGVTAHKLGAGTYAVDFGHDISSCGFVMTQGEAGAGSAGGAITGATDRAGNPEAVFATTRTNANVLADRAFQLVVVC
jgi:hypothetical protein